MLAMQEWRRKMAVMSMPISCAKSYHYLLFARQLSMLGSRLPHQSAFPTLGDEDHDITINAIKSTTQDAFGAYQY
jgi:hypothetical protein